MSIMRFFSIEDNAIEREILELYCNLMNITVDFAVDGNEAVEKLVNMEGTYDAILLDIDLPEVSGLELLDQIRSMTTNVSDIPVFAITACALKGDRERALEAGCAGYLPKPYSHTDLKYFLEQHFVSPRVC